MGLSWRSLLVGFLTGVMFMLFVSSWQRALVLTDVVVTAPAHVGGGSRPTIVHVSRGVSSSPPPPPRVQQPSEEEQPPPSEPEDEPTTTVAAVVKETAAPTTLAPVVNEPMENDFTKHLYEQLKRAREPGVDPTQIIPVIITPTFHDGEELKRMILSLNVPVRYVVFIWNSHDAILNDIFRDFRRIPIPGAVTIHHNPDNFGFSASINLGVKLGLSKPSSEVPWYFVINCDVSFPETTLSQMVRNAHQSDFSKISMMYGPGIDHYAFIVTRRAIEVAGLMDENFYPAYYEDVDWRWRMNLAGFEEFVMNLPVNHIRSVNLRRADANFHAQHHRHANGWPYGGMKWGEVNQNRIHDRYPPSGWKNPFGINMSLDHWVIDPERLACIKTGHGGPTHPGTGGHCWYNGYKVLAPVLPEGTWFPECMKKPYPDAFKPR